MGLGTGLDRCGKSRPHRDWIPGPSSSQRVAILTTPSLLPIQHLYFSNTKMSDIGHTTPVIRVYHKTVVNTKVKPTLQDLVKNLLDPTFYLQINKSVVSEKLCCFVILDKSLKYSNHKCSVKLSETFRENFFFFCGTHFIIKYFRLHAPFTIRMLNTLGNHFVETGLKP